MLLIYWINKTYTITEIVNNLRSNRQSISTMVDECKKEGWIIVTKIGSWRVMLSTCLGMVFTSLLLNQLGKIEGTGPMLDILPHYHFVMGSFAFGMVFMATDPVSSSQTNKGRYRK